ncbi:MAG TPA: hypothetical protein VLV31_00705 [Candidatus Acidoferrales bacterium]|nr:hypothetical protein [Candidatus Acidoferrales bacterium]
MVQERQSKHGLIYVCELCGFGYSYLAFAEDCEEFCGLHGGSAINITSRAVFRPRVRVVSAAG